MTTGLTTWLGQPIDTDDLASTVRDLGVLVLDFGRVPRATFHQDGTTPETDTTHTVMVGLIACSLARMVDGLDVGLVAQLALLHDLHEVYAGDTHTIRLLTAEQEASKRDRERAAWVRITRRFAGMFPWISLGIESYNQKMSPEARFVWGVDKITPKITHIANGCVTPIAAGVSVHELANRYRVQREEMLTHCGEWPILIAVYDRLVEEELAVLDLYSTEGGDRR